VIEDTLLISCPGADGGLFVVNGETCVRISSRATTGISSTCDRLIFAYQGDDGKSVRVISDGWTKEIKLSESRLDLHDVLFWQDRTYVVATETNSVFSMDANFTQVDSWCLPGDSDSSHLNSIIFYDGRLLVSVFGRFKHHREYKNGTVGRGEVIDIQTGETFIGGLSQPHSLTVIGNLLYLCNSEEQRVRVYRGSELLQQIDVSGYARGLAISNENVYVGISLSRNAESLMSSSKAATIMELDSSTMQLKSKISLPCREIYGIRVVTDVKGLFPHLLVDLVEEKVKADELSIQYKRGYESYLREHERLVHEIRETKAKNDLLSQEIGETKAKNDLLSQEIGKTKAKNDLLSQEIGKTKAKNDLLSQELENVLTAIQENYQSKYWRFTKHLLLTMDKIKR